ncbi:MAG: hypothetical protein ACREEQ_00750, partial [Caulobacteraceae bacterium]
APDAAIRSLSAALSADKGHDEGLTQVHYLVQAEAADRRARNFVFAPIAPLCAEADASAGPRFRARTLALLWRALKAEARDEVAEAKLAIAERRPGDSSPDLIDSLCARAAKGLRDGQGVFAPAAQAADDGAGRAALASCLDIAPIVRRALDQMPEWLGRMTEEKAAKLRLSYRDAVAVTEDAGPRFFEMLAAHLAEPWLILRVISGVMDRPSEAYMAASELASFGERVMADIDRALALVAAFRAGAGRAAARAAAEAVHRTTAEIVELEQSIQLTPDGAWGRRLARQKIALAGAVEGQFKSIHDAVAQALPVQTVRLGARSARSTPKLVGDPDAGSVEAAATLLTFVAEVRSSAAAGGFASSHAKALETLGERLDSYVEEVLEEIRAADGVDPVKARAFLEVAAKLCGLARDEKAAQVVRRRAKAA